MDELEQFYALVNFFVSFVGGSLLLAIFYNIRKRLSQKLSLDDETLRIDNGLFFLAMAVYTWALSSIISHVGFNESVVSLGNNIVSIVNNLLLLIAISYFRYAPAFLYNKANNLRIIIGIALGVAVITYLIGFFYHAEVGSFILQNIPDFLLSGLVSYLLAISLFKTFVHRGLKLVATISVVVISIMFFSQFPEILRLYQNGFYSLLIRIVAKTSLIFIFLVLATSWVIELASTPTIKEMKLNLDDWSLIRLTIPSKNIINESIDFGSKTTQFKNLLKFAIRRKYGSSDEQAIEVGGNGEITSQTYLSRIIDNINKDIGLVEDDRLSRKDIFTFIGDGKYRLRFNPENITIDSALLEEFSHSVDNQSYKAICNQL